MARNDESTALVKMPTMVIKPQKSYEVEGNFEEVETYLKGVRAKYKDLVFSSDNIESAKVIKSELRTLRTSLEKIAKDVKTERFNSPKSIFDAKMNALLAITGEVEGQIDKALDAEDQKRIDELTQAFDDYKEHFQSIFSLEDSYLARIEYKKGFYNKTALEKDSKADIESQFKTLKAEQTARNGSVKLIQKACKDTPAINVDEQTAKLDRGIDVASILEWIDGEIERLAAVNAPAEDEEDEEGAQEPPLKTAAGTVSRMSETDFPGKTKSMVISITYPVDLGDDLTKLFRALKEKGIIWRPVKPEELVGGKLS
jgi:hypothetical protein